jgi:hypothetical protein
VKNGQPPAGTMDRQMIDQNMNSAGDRQAGPRPPQADV